MATPTNDTYTAPAGSASFACGRAIATQATLSGPATAAANAATTYRVTLNAIALVDYTVTWSRSNSGTGSATSTIPAGQTFVDAPSTWAAAGSARTVDFTISPAIARAGNPVSVTISSSVPSWLAAITVGTVGVAGGSLQASGVGWSGTHPGGTGIYTAVLDAYSGGILNTVGLYIGANFVSGTWLCCWGGGHTDYGGDEIYAFGPLESNAPTWSRLMDPRVPGPNDVARDTSGYPTSRHTYNSINFISLGGRNWMYSAGQPFGYYSAVPSYASDVFDFSVASPNSNFPWIAKADAAGVCDVSAVDTTTGKIWGIPYAGNSIALYDIATDAWSSANFKSPLGTLHMAAIDTGRGLMLTNNGSGAICAYRLNNGLNNDFYTLSTTGTGPGTRGPFIYDPRTDSFRCWVGGNTLYTLTPPASSPYQGGNAWVWSSVTISGSTVPAQNASGTYGRFARVVIGGISGYLLANSSASSTLFFRET